MKRRHFIAGAAALAPAALWPSWLREAFADAPKGCELKAASKAAPKAAPASASALDVAAAFRRAARARRPLLVFVIPANDSEKWDRGHTFGELLNAGSDADIAPLDACDVVCATMEGLREIVPSAGRGEPLMVLVKTTALPAVAEPLDVEMPSYADVMTAYKRAASRPGVAVAVIEQRISALGGLLRRALGSSSLRVKERAELVRERLVKKPPPGTHWARSEGCGVAVEGVHDRARTGCGMAFIPEKTSRFLYFYSTESSL